MLAQQGDVSAVWLDDDDCDIEAFSQHINQTTESQYYPCAEEITHNVPVYDGDRVRRILRHEDQARTIMAEWHRSFRTGPGIVVIRRGYEDAALIDAVTEELSAIMLEESANGVGVGDHFAASGANSRVWNAHEKLCVRAPALYAHYNSNEMIRRVSESWLGRGYQVTFQVNVVHPGGQAQVAHRDYHMGFQDAATLKGFPAVQHALSASLTLQGAVAHSDVPIESGPTKLLPYSQSYLPGYIAVLRPEFREVFEASCVQLPMAKGDLMFFNPATFHAAGENRTDHIHRFVNLMQIGSAYGRSIEIVDRDRMTLAVFEDLKRLLITNELTAREIDNVVAATAEGYPFPANLDLNSPLSGMAPSTQQGLLRQALIEDWTLVRLEQAVFGQAERKRSH